MFHSVGSTPVQVYVFALVMKVLLRNPNNLYLPLPCLSLWKCSCHLYLIYHFRWYIVLIVSFIIPGKIGASLSWTSVCIEGTAKFIFDVVSVQFPLLVDPSMFCPWFLGPDIKSKKLSSEKSVSYFLDLLCLGYKISHFRYNGLIKPRNYVKEQ